MHFILPSGSDQQTKYKVDHAYEQYSEEENIQKDSSIITDGRQSASKAGKRRKEQAYDQIYLMNTLYSTYKDQSEEPKSQNKELQTSSLRRSTRKFIPNPKFANQAHASEKKIWGASQL